MVMAIFFVMAIIICGYALILLLNILFGGLKILFVFLMLGYILMSSIGIAGLIKYKKLHKVAKVSTILLMIPVFFSTILMMFFRKSIWQYMLSIYFSVSNILTIRKT